jgi:ribosomal protein S18 acetylase RimI-like enzyme
MKVRKSTENDNKRCIEIAGQLTDWFDNKEITEIKKNIPVLPTYVYEDNGKILGFVCVKEKFGTTLEIDSIGVDVNNHRGGIGTQLIEYIEKKVANGKVIMVKTLDSSSDYEPYFRTRAFYEKNGFVKIEVVDPYPGWSEDCPCAIYIKR